MNASSVYDINLKYCIVSWKKTIYYSLTNLMTSVLTSQSAKKKYSVDSST